MHPGGVIIEAPWSRFIDGTGALKKTPSIGKSRGGWTSKIHLVAADAGGSKSVAPRGSRPQKGASWFGSPAPHTVFAGAYDNQTPTGPGAWALHRSHPSGRPGTMTTSSSNEIERLRRLKGYRRLLSLRETGCPLPRIHPFRPHLRSASCVNRYALNRYFNPFVEIFFP